MKVGALVLPRIGVDFLLCRHAREEEWGIFAGLIEGNGSVKRALSQIISFQLQQPVRVTSPSKLGEVNGDRQKLEFYTCVMPEMEIENVPGLEIARFAKKQLRSLVPFRDIDILAWDFMTKSRILPMDSDQLVAGYQAVVEGRITRQVEEGTMDLGTALVVIQLNRWFARITK